MKKNQVILIYGLPASGKYSVAKMVQEKCGGVLLDNHYFYDMFIGLTEGSDENWGKFVWHVGHVRKAFIDVIKNFYPQKQPVRYIFTGVYLRGEKGPAILQKFARDINADFIPIELNVTKEVLLERCDTEQRRKRKKLSNKDKYNKQIEYWMCNKYSSRNPNKLVLDTTNMTLEETFNKVQKHLKKFN